jgi:spermidine synthase
VVTTSESAEIRKILPAVFFLSGMTALMYEVVWTRPLQMIFGSTIYAASAMLTTFFIGFALGSFIFRNSAYNSNPLKLIIFLQTGIGLSGFIIPFLFRILPSIYISLSELPGFLFMQFIMIFLVLIIPATLFGAMWPVVSKMYIDDIGKDAGKLYAFNSFGAFLGPLLAGFVLIPFIGIFATSMLAALTNISVAGYIYVKVGKNG